CPDTASTALHRLSLHAALPICHRTGLRVLPPVGGSGRGGLAPVLIPFVIPFVPLLGAGLLRSGLRCAGLGASGLLGFAGCAEAFQAGRLAGRSWPVGWRCRRLVLGRWLLDVLGAGVGPAGPVDAHTLHPFRRWNGVLPPGST